MPGELLEFYGLREHPFGVSPNPRYFYPGAQHREALATLISGIENFVGLSALIAEAGVGKTTVLRELLRQLNDRASTALVSNTQCNGLELIRQIVMGLQIPGGESEQDPVRLYHMLNAFASERQQTKPVVIIIDEAQNLEPSALETLRLLSNLEAEDRKLLHIILAGQPELKQTLRSHSQMFQRITVVARIRRLSPEEIEECIAFRLRTAGYAGPPLFSIEAMARIKQASKGVPRELNRICLNALEAAFTLRKREIGIEVVEQVLSDLDLSCDPPVETPSQIDRRSFDIPAGSSDTQADAWAMDPFVDIRLGDEVIDSVLSGLDPSGDSHTATSTLQTTHAKPEEPQIDANAFDDSEKPRIPYVQSGLAPTDDEIRSLLAEMDLNAGISKVAKKESPKVEPHANVVEPKNSGAPAEPEAPKTSADPRVLEIFARRKPLEAAIQKTNPEAARTSPEPVARRMREDSWNTGVTINSSGQSGSYHSRSSGTHNAPAKARKKIDPVLFMVIVFVVVMVILHYLIPFISTHAPKKRRSQLQLAPLSTVVGDRACLSEWIECTSRAKA